MNRSKAVIVVVACLALAFLATGASAGTMGESPSGSGNWQVTVLVPGVGVDCPNLSVQVTYDANTQTVGFQHAGGATAQSVTGTTQAHTGANSTGSASTATGQTGVAPHAAGAAGVATPLTTAKGLCGGTANATATGTITYTFTKADCTYTITLTVNFDSSGAVSTSPSTTP